MYILATYLRDFGLIRRLNRTERFIQSQSITSQLLQCSDWIVDILIVLVAYSSC